MIHILAHAPYRTGMLSVGVVFPPHADVAALPSFAQRTEEQGFDELWLVEDCFLSGAVVMATAALAATCRLRVGIGLMPAPMRNPAISAMEIGALARLYPGRLIVTLGRGVRAWMEQIGALPARPLTALGQVTSAVRALLAGQTVTMSGSDVQLAGVNLEAPPDRPPPVLIGSTGPRGLALAGEVADGVLLPEGCGPEFVRYARRRTSQSAPRSRPPLTVVYAWLRLDDDERQARLALRPVVDSWLEGGLYPGPVAHAGINSPLPPGPVAPTLARALAVAGDPAACAASAGAFVEAGADTLVLMAVGDDADRQYERFAREVLRLLPARRHRDE